MGLSPIFLHLSLSDLDDHFLNVYFKMFFHFEAALNLQKSRKTRTKTPCIPFTQIDQLSVCQFA